MKIKIITLLALCFAFSSVNAQDKLVKQVEDYTSLEVSGPVQVELVKSDSKEMSITAKENNPQDLDIKYKDGVLEIKARTSLKDEKKFFVTLPYTKIEELDVVAGGAVYSEEVFEAKYIELVAGTGGRIELELKLEELKAKVTGGADMLLSGEVETQRVTAATAGNYHAYQLACQDSYLKSVTGGILKATANRSVDADAQTKGFIDYVGNPDKSSTTTSLGGEIISSKEK